MKKLAKKFYWNVIYRYIFGPLWYGFRYSPGRIALRKEQMKWRKNS